jgi:hypothetical protein
MSSPQKTDRRVDELQAVHVVGQEFAGKGRFSRAVGTGNDIEIRFERCHHAYPIGQPPRAAMASSTAAIRWMVSARTATIRCDDWRIAKGCTKESESRQQHSAAMVGNLVHPPLMDNEEPLIPTATTFFLLISARCPASNRFVPDEDVDLTIINYMSE